MEARPARAAGAWLEGEVLASMYQGMGRTAHQLPAEPGCPWHGECLLQASWYTLQPELGSQLPTSKSSRSRKGWEGSGCAPAMRLHGHPLSCPPAGFPLAREAQLVGTTPDKAPGRPQCLSPTGLGDSRSHSQKLEQEDHTLAGVPTGDTLESLPHRLPMPCGLAGRPCSPPAFLEAFRRRRFFLVA